MAIELVKDILKINEIRGKERVEALVEAEMYLNHTKPEIEKILWTDGKVEIMNVKIIQNKVLVSGIVKLKVVYKAAGEDLEIYILETTTDFNEEVEIEGIDEEMSSDVKANLEYIEYEIVDAKKVLLQALVNIDAKVESINSIEIIQNIKGEENLQTLKEKIGYKDILASNESNVLVREAFELEDNMPAIEEVLKVQLEVYEDESKVVEDGLIIAGIVKGSLLYIGDGKLNSIKKEMSFNHFLDMPGIERDLNCQLDLEIDSGDYELKEDIEGNLRIVDLEVKVKVKGKVYEEKEKDIIVDVYSTKREINVEKEEIEVFQNIKNFIMKEKVKRQIKDKSFDEVYSIEGNPVLVDSRYIDGKIVIEGFLSTNIVYLEGNTKEIEITHQELPFKFYIDGEDIEASNIIIDIDCILEGISYKIDNGELEIEGSLRNDIQVTSKKKVNIILNLESTDKLIDKKSRSSITIYIVQKGDMLWDIAKRYNTTMEEIVLSNNLSPSELIMPGEKIIIEKLVDVDFS